MDGKGGIDTFWARVGLQQSCLNNNHLYTFCYDWYESDQWAIQNIMTKGFAVILRWGEKGPLLPGVLSVLFVAGCWWSLGWGQAGNRPVANFLASTDLVKNASLRFPQASRSFPVGLRKDRIENGDKKGLRRELKLKGIATLLSLAAFLSQGLLIPVDTYSKSLGDWNGDPIH